MSHAEPKDDGAVFDALIAARREEVSDTPAPPVADDPPPEPAADEPESHDEPAPEAGSSVSGGENSAPDDAIDLETLPPAVRAKIERAAQLEAELQRERSDKLAALNRLQPTQRRLSDLERQLATASKTPPAAAPVASAPVPDPSAVSPFDTPEWKDYEHNFPQEAKIQRKAHEAAIARIAKAEEQLAARLQQAEQKFGRVDQFVQEQAVSREMAALSNAHPDWQDLVLPRDASEAVQIGENAVVNRQFAEWLSVQNPAVQGLFGSNAAQDNIDLMHAYKRDIALAELHMAAPSAPVASPDAEAALRAHQRREQTRSTSVAPDLRGQSAAARVSTQNMDSAALFDHLMRQRRAQNR